MGNEQEHHDGFCDECLVSLDLHPSDDVWGCDIARSKADLLDQFAAIGRTR